MNDNEGNLLADPERIRVHFRTYFEQTLNTINENTTSYEK